MRHRKRLSRLGRRMGVAGLVLMLASIALSSLIWAGSASGGEGPRRHIFEVPQGSRGLQSSFSTEAAGSCRLAVQMRVTAESLLLLPRDSTGRSLPRYRFPVSYEVRSAGGRAVVRREAELAWDGTSFASVRFGEQDEKMTRMMVKHAFRPFRLPAGRFNFQFNLLPDRDYEAEAGQVQVSLYEEGGRAGRGPMFWTTALTLGLGLGLAAAGFVCDLIGRGKAVQDSDGAPEERTPAQ